MDKRHGEILAMKYKRLFSILWKSVVNLIIAGMVFYASIVIYVGPFSFTIFSPINIPLAAHQDGAAVSADFQVKDVGLYQFDLLFHFSGQDREKERNRIMNLPGARLNADGTHDGPGIPITVEYRISGIEKKTRRQINRNRRLTTKGFAVQSASGYTVSNGGALHREIDAVKLYPGTYHISLKTIGNVSEFSDIPVSFCLFHDWRVTYDE